MLHTRDGEKDTDGQDTDGQDTGGFECKPHTQLAHTWIRKARIVVYLVKTELITDNSGQRITPNRSYGGIDLDRNGGHTDAVG